MSVVAYIFTHKLFYRYFLLKFGERGRKQTKLEIRIRLKRRLEICCFCKQKQKHSPWKQSIKFRSSSFCPTRLRLQDKCKNVNFWLFWKIRKFLYFVRFFKYGWSQISVRFALRGFVSEINAKINIFDFFEKSYF